VTIKASIDEDHIGPHKKAELPEGMLEQYKHLPDVFQSHRVLFRITNTSGFTLRQPTLTFRLPVTKQHPHQDRSSQTWITTFRSNLFNSQIDLKTLRFGDTSLLSNSNLPYWNDQETNTIWIRMVLAGGEVPPFEVTVSVNSENAEGVTKTVSIPTSLDH
jgi:hypothetical protein